MSRKKKENLSCQLVLPFDFWEEERKAEEKKKALKIDSLKTFPAPANENQELFNLQKRYYKGDRKALDQMFIILLPLAEKLVNIEIRKRKNLYFSKEKKKELSVDAAALVIEQIKRNELMIETSFIAYLRLQTLKVMFGQTKAERFESYCVRHGINLFQLSEQEKFRTKAQFERETGGMKNEA